MNRKIVLSMVFSLVMMLPLCAYAGIQTLIDAAPDGTVGSSTVVNIPAGTYAENVVVAGRKYLTIQPAGGTATDTVTVNGTFRIIENRGVTGWPPCIGITLNGLKNGLKLMTITGPSGVPNETGEGPGIGVVTIRGGRDCTISGCTVTANAAATNYQAGARVYSGTYGSQDQADNNTVTGNIVYGNVITAGIEVRGDGVLGPVRTRIVDNEVYNTTYGLFNAGTASTGGNTAYIDNYVHDVGVGMSVDMDNTIISGNLIKFLPAGSADGILISKPVSGRSVNVTDNEISGVFFGIKVYGDGTFGGNIYADNYIHDSITANGPVGIYINGDVGAIIQRNVIAKISTRAVYIENATDNPVIDHNTFYSTGPNNYAVRFGGTTSLGTLTNNIFAKNLGDLETPGAPYGFPVPTGVTEGYNLWWHTTPDANGGSGVRWYTTPWWNYEGTPTPWIDVFGIFSWQPIYGAAVFSSEDSNNTKYLYLMDPGTPVEILKGDSAGSFMGALPPWDWRKDWNCGGKGWTVDAIGSIDTDQYCNGTGWRKVNY